MKIPLPKLMRHWREAEFKAGYTPWAYKRGLALWAWLAGHPRLYHTAMRFAVSLLGTLGRRRGSFQRLPLAGGWTKHRDLPAPQGRTFQQLWAERKVGAPR
jgi:L-lactate dehydrogenase complex protein LldF